MAYEKTKWNNDFAPDIDADHLNHIEQGIYENSQGLEQLKTTVEDLDERATEGLVEVNNKLQSTEDTLYTYIYDTRLTIEEEIADSIAESLGGTKLSIEDNHVVVTF